MEHVAYIHVTPATSPPKEFIRCEDLLFIDKWTPLPFLLAEPNFAAMDEVKAKFLKIYKTFLKAPGRVSPPLQDILHDILMVCTLPKSLS